MRGVPKRFQIRAGDWETVVGRLQELVLANSGEDEFQEIFKILVAKLFSEKFPGATPSFQTHRSPTNTAKAINDLIARANVQWFGTISGDPRSRLTDEHLSICVDAIADLNVCDTHLEILDGFFEYLVGHVAKGAKGQYFTPRQIVELCVKIIDPRPSEMILDPACGSGGFLIHALNHNARRLDVSPHEYGSKFLWGCDFDARAVQIAKTLMLVAGDGGANLHQLNSLRKPFSGGLFDGPADDVPRITIEDLLRTKARKVRGFDVILTNPPFAGEIREPSFLANYQVAKRNRRIERDVLFVERCIDLLRPGGRLGIVLPHNKLGGAPWAYLRDWLIRRLQVVAVVGLDRNAFLPHTHQKTSVLFGIKRTKPLSNPSNEPILFAISESSGKDSAGRIRERFGASPDQTAWLRADHDLEDIVEEFEGFVRANGLKWAD